MGFRFQHEIQSSDVHIKWGLHLSMQARVVTIVIMGIIAIRATGILAILVVIVIINCNDSIHPSREA